MLLPRIITVAAVAVLMLTSTLSAVTLTVCKTGDCQFTSIQAAITAAGPGDEVVIRDEAVYAEQVTIDSTKNGLTLRSVQPQRLNKPTILFQDKINVGPKTAKEALVDSLITFDRNGALQIIKAANIRIEGIAIDGGGVYPFGYDGIWESKFALQSGNAAITLFESGDVVVRDCDIRNAFLGINVKDRNEGGVYAHPNPADVSLETILQYSRVSRTGNHLIEYNRIHDNSYGFNFESSWDMGSTVRYNLVYENHHPTAAIATKVKALTSEGGNMTGGAFIFKDDMLSPLSIYNNTFWHNSLIFGGNWKSGGQHLLFNNIYGAPNEYFGTSTTTFSASFEMSKCFANRMHSCVYAAMQQEPTLKYTTITYDLKPAQSADSTYKQGALITPFPASAEVRWVETKFLSTDPAALQFLTPDWSDSMVMSTIIDKGWVEAGVKDPNGSRADLGAIPSEGGRPIDVVTLRPIKPVEINGTVTTLNFELISRLPETTSKDFKIVYLYAVTKLDTADVYGSAVKPIAVANIIKVAIPATPLVAGANTIQVTLPAGGTGDFAFFEMIIEATGTDGMPFTSAVGFIPYRRNDYQFDVVLLDKVDGTPVTSVRAGQQVALKVVAKNAGTVFSEKIDLTAVSLLSRFDLLNPAGKVVADIPGGILETTTDVVFTRVPQSGVEFVHVAGTWVNSSKVVGFFGSSKGVKVLPGPADSIVLIQPATKRTAVIYPGTTQLVKVQAFDKYGNAVDSECKIKVVSLKPEIGKVTDTIMATGIGGISTHHALVTSGDKDQLFPIVATLVEKPSVCDTAYFKVGQHTAATPSSAIVSKPRQTLYELIDLRGRVVQRQSVFASGRDRHLFPATVSRGFYLVRTTDIATGKVTMRRRVVLGR